MSLHVPQSFRLLLIGALVFIYPVVCLCQTPQKTVVLDPASPGRIFDGIGAVSAGASSRLLVDYPEPYRSQVLDYLFLPNYGAALQHLKVEIGADVNSTDGAEPSHMRSPSDRDYTRGYEWWLMREARKRNPHIVLDTLPWGAPGWVGENTLYTPAMARYVADFLNGAKKQSLDIAYTGVWNEKTYDAAYVKTLHQQLHESAPTTKLVCCDEYPRTGPDEWDMLAAMKTDTALRDSIDVLSVHYPRIHGKLTTPPNATDIGKPLWSSEDQPESSASTILSRDWAIGGRSLAHIYNENYLKGGFTATEIWSPVTSYYDILAAPNSGLMYANMPWSGHYDVQGAIWATAHTTQFAKPGWRYLDTSSGNLPKGGSYVTLLSPSAKDWSIVAETIDAKAAQSVLFRTAGGLDAGTVHVWETNARHTFEHVADVRLKDGVFSYTFDPDSLYSLTTTTGQGRGNAQPPPAKAFPLPYRDDFEMTPLQRAPRYLADQDGAFEAAPCQQRTGRCLEQVITSKPIPWGPIPDPWTLAGDAAWTDYAVEVDARLEDTGDLTLSGRIDSADVFKDQKANYPSGYIFRVDGDGAWQLLACTYKQPTKTLAEGKRGSLQQAWHHLSLRFRQQEVIATLDGQVLASVHDAAHRAGMFGFGSGWHRAQFDNLAVTR